LGGIVRYRVRAGGQTLVVDVPHGRAEQVYASGAKVGLTIDPRQIAVLR
jgi:hypothetical protein